MMFKHDNSVGSDPKTSSSSAVWLVPVLGLILTIVVAVAVLTTKWQSTLDATTQNAERIVKLDSTHESDVEKTTSDHETDIARLDESNRNRRNQIADLEERIAYLEATIATLQAQGR